MQASGDAGYNSWPKSGAGGEVSSNSLSNAHYGMATTLQAKCTVFMHNVKMSNAYIVANSFHLRNIVYACVLLSGFFAIVHLECERPDQCKKWVSDFSKTSFCTWRVRRTYPDGRRGLLWRMDYVCQHSSFNKNHTKRQKTKDTDCAANLVVKVMQISFSC